MTEDRKNALLQPVRRALERTLGSAPSPEADPPDPEILRRMRAALDRMDETQRAVFERARFRDLDHRQIAAELGLTIREVERHLASALLHIWRAADEEREP